jgi:hypothetical protein
MRKRARKERRQEKEKKKNLRPNNPRTLRPPDS